MAELQELEIVKRIEQARIETGLSQGEMAELLQVADRTYWNYENNRVPYKLMGRISEVTGRSLKWLLHGEEESANAEVAQLERKLDVLLTHFGLSVDIDTPEKILTDVADHVEGKPPAGASEPRTPQRRPRRKRP